MKIISILLFLSVYFNASAQNQSKKLSPGQMQNDLSILQSAWQNLHPGIYRYNTSRQLESHFNSIKKKCKAPLAEKTFYLLLSQLAQQVKCGHTFLNPLNMPKETQKRILPVNYIIPVFFELIPEKKIIITHNLSDNLNIERGDEIVAINGIASKRIIDSLLTVSRSDGRNSTGKKLNNINETPDEADAYSLFDIYFPLFFPSKITTFKITLKKYAAAVTTSYSINATTLEARIAAYEKWFGKVPVAEKTWDYKILNEETAYAKFGTFAFWNSNFNTTGYVDSLFNDLSKKPGIKNLVIDIRNNEGGDNTGNYILSYVTANKIGCNDPDRVCYRYLTIPDSLLPYLDTWDNAFKKPKDPAKFKLNELGLYEARNEGEPCDYINPRPAGFRGKVFLLTNAKNSSAGYEMARNFRTAGLGTIVGETTGGSQQGINGGEFFFLTLPNATFEIDLPLIYGYHANKPDEGIIPDYQIKTTQKDIKNNKDPQLEYVLLQIANQKRN
jgi:hypothetical protein